MWKMHCVDLETDRGIFIGFKRVVKFCGRQRAITKAIGGRWYSLNSGARLSGFRSQLCHFLAFYVSFSFHVPFFPNAMFCSRLYPQPENIT